MKENTAETVKSYVEAVNRLFDDVESWIKSLSLNGIRQEIEISEESSGSYKVRKLILHDESGKKIAEFMPVATFIIGGNGRIDLNGTIDKAIIVNIEVGGPSLTTTLATGGQTDTQTSLFYKGIDKQGWYWIENGRRGKANYFDKKLFVELLKEVSDYELG